MTFWKRFCSFKLWFFLVLNFIYLFDEISCKGPRNDLQTPRASDLVIFLNTLKKITDYAMNNANAVDMNLMLGIFLAKVNLEASRRVLGALPYDDEAALLEEVDSGCDVILRNYHLQVAMHNTSHSREARISSLFTNSTAWALALPPYTTPRVPRASRHRPATPRKSDALRWEWEMYRDAVRQYEAWAPSPQLSDECLMTLAADVAADSADSAADSLKLRPCRTNDACYDTVYHGTWFGYALTHRLLIITSGLFSRHCYLSTPAEDARLTRQLCARTYTETAFIAHNHYSLRDLFMEQISMCSLLGHVEFLDRSWLIQIIDWQHSAGCFQEQYQRHSYQEQNKGMKLKHLGKNFSTYYFENFLANHINDNNNRSIKDRSGKSTEQVNNKQNKEVENEERLQQVLKQCDSHVTAVAAAAISAAVRFIIQFDESAISIRDY